MLKYLCLCVFANFIIANATHEKRFAHFQQKTELNEFLCKDYIFKLKSESPIQCGLFCQNNKLCNNVFFDINSHTCTGCEPKSEENQHAVAKEPTLSYEIHRFHPGTSNALVAKTSTSDSATFSPSEKTQFSTTAVSLTTADAFKTNDFPTSSGTALSTTTDFSTTTGFTTTTDSFKSKDFPTSTDTALSTTFDISTTTGFPTTTDSFTSKDFPTITGTALSTTSDISTTTGFPTTTKSFKSNDFPTSAGTALSTTSDFSTTRSFTPITDSAKITDYLPTSATFTNQQMMMMNSTSKPDQFSNVDEGQWITWGISKYMLMYNVDFRNAEVQCSNKKVSQDGHLAWVESEAENNFLAKLLQTVTNNYLFIDAFIGVKVDSMNVLSLVPSGQLQAEVYKRSTKYPNYGKENCVAIQSTGDWLAKSCFEIITAICEV